VITAFPHYLEVDREAAARVINAATLLEQLLQKR
jgi:hypothetical protein